MAVERRGFLKGLATLLAAPAIIKPGILMPVVPPLLNLPSPEPLIPPGYDMQSTTHLNFIAREIARKLNAKLNPRPGRAVLATGFVGDHHLHQLHVDMRLPPKDHLDIILSPKDYFERMETVSQRFVDPAVEFFAEKIKHLGGKTFTLPPEIPKGAHEAVVETVGEVGVRGVLAYDIYQDMMRTRFDLRFIS